jgi:HSP20 family protein
VKRDDITIELAADEIVITGEFKEKERTGLLRSHTRHTSGFEYRSSLPRDVDTENITADLADGVLSVRIPKTAAAKPRRIAITGG